MLAIPGSVPVSLREIYSPSTDAAHSVPEVITDRTSFSDTLWFSSARASIRHALLDAGLGPDDEVLVPAYTCTAVGRAVDSVATPVYVDVDSQYTLDVEAATAQVTDQTAAVLAIHPYGRPCPMESIRDFADEHDLVVIEDAAQALGLLFFDGVDVIGRYSDYCVFSFRFYKEATAHKGGLLLSESFTQTNTEATPKRFPRLRLTSIWAIDTVLTVLPGQVYQPLQSGILDSAVDAASASTDCTGPRVVSDWSRDILSLQTAPLPDRIESRRRNAALFDARLPDAFDTPTRESHTYFRYPVLVPDGRRNALCAALRRNGVGCGRMYASPLSDPGACPTADRLSEQVLTLPVHAGLDTETIERIADRVRRVWDRTGATDTPS